MDLSSLSPEQFESLTFDIVNALGMRNTVWRTPGSDVGRDIEGNYFISDLSGHYQQQKWYVECKRYASSVDWPTVWNKIAYAEAHCSDILLFVTSSSLSPQAVDQVRIWNESNKKPLIRFWGATEVIAKLNIYPQIAKKYALKCNLDSSLDVFYPAIDLLMRITNSMSPDAGNISDDKIWLVHSISELISVRMLDVKSGYGFCFKPHKPDDYFPWSVNLGCNLENFDKYSTRALLSYLSFAMKNRPDIKQNNASELLIFLARKLIDSEENHVKVISDLSNFNIALDGKTISLSLI